MSTFITNSQDKDLKSRLNTLITASSELKFLVGFFYFSGIRELYESLINNKNVNIKVLVGLNIDLLNGNIIESVNFDNTELSYNNISGIYIDDIKKSISNDVFDTKEFTEQIDFFIKLISDNRLIIRKTEKPNHAKLYIFKLDETQVGRNEIFITGSSNLTKAGLLSQNEFNVEISDYGFNEAENYFDELWEQSVQITEINTIKKTLLTTLQHETHLKKIAPFEAYAFILKSYLDTFDNDKKNISVEQIMDSSGYKPYKYQIDAVKQALSIIEKHGGVIIADVVGLGKTVIACAIAWALRKRGIVISPPSLVGDANKKSGWKKYIEDFKLIGWEIRSLGKLEDTLTFINEYKDFEVVIIDEAHRFRNEDTKDYELLKNICRNKIVILLTATPFNNRPSDVFALLKLFITPKKSTITIDNNLENQFRKFESLFKDLSYIKRYHNHHEKSKLELTEKKYRNLYGKLPIDLNKVNLDIRKISTEIKNILEPIIIRRNRIDLKKHPEYSRETTQLPEVKDPIEWFFELDDEQNKFYDKIIKSYFTSLEEAGKFKGAIYRPYEYEEGLINIEKEEEEKTEKGTEYQQQRNLFDFMRRLVVKRFESSFGAFQKTIENFKHIHEIVAKFIEDNDRYILDRDLLEKIYELDSEEIEGYLNEYETIILKGNYPKKYKIYKVNNFKNKNFLQHIKEDISLFESILEEMESLKLTDKDPKTACIINNIKEWLKKEPKRKIVVFSEFVDTVKYLDISFQNAFNNRVLVVAGDLPNYKINAIYENFDASYSIQKQKNDYDILLCSDKISEGFNLNRAGMVINYDIPWNPVRVIQRLGRINRISKKVFDYLYIVNFFPTQKGTDIVQSREIAQNKMFMIHNALGEDVKIFDAHEEISASNLYNKVMSNPEALEDESFYTKVYNKFYKIKETYPALVENLNKFPNRIKLAKKFDIDELLVFIRKNSLYVLTSNYANNDIVLTSLQDVIDRIEVEYEEKPLELSENFWDVYDKIRNYKEKNIKGKSIQSIEKKAYDMLQYLLKDIDNNATFKQYEKFLTLLKEDLLNFGTLSDYTLRRIANLQKVRDDQIILKELEALKNEIGEDYLEKEKQKKTSLKKEIIIAVENRKNNI